MIDLGTVRPGSTVRIPFSSFDKDDGSAITMTNFAAADILVYKDGSTTERASTSGFTATTDFDSKTGKHLIVLDLSDNTTSGFWNAGSEYLVAVDAVTVDAVTTGGWVARFRIGYPGATLDTTIATLSSQTSFTLTSGPAEDDALNDQWAIIHDIASGVQCAKVLILDYTGSTRTVTLAAGATFTVAAGDNISIMGPAPLQPTVLGRRLDVSSGGEAGIDWANVGSPTTTVVLSGTSIGSVAGTVGSISGVTFPSNFASLAITVGGAVTAGTVSDKTGYSISGTTTTLDALQTALNSAHGSGSWATATGFSTHSAADVWAVGTRTITGGTITTYTGNTPQTGDAYAIVSSGTHGNAALKTLVDDIPTNAELTSALAGADDAVLAAIAALSIPTVAAIADGVWDEVMSGHTTDGTYGGRIVRATNANVSVQITGSNHVAADVHEFQAGVITSGDFSTDAITSTALAASAVAEIVTGVLTTAMTEAYRATNAAPTVAQALFEILQNLTEFAISGTTKTVKKLDGSTTAKTYTLDSSTAPTSITEAT